jgi:hypothetical protein
VAISGIRSLDVVLDEVHRQRDAQLAYFDATDTKAGVVLGFAGALVALSPSGAGAILAAARGVAVMSGIFALASFWPRKYWQVDLRELRARYIAAEPAFTRLALLDSEIVMEGRVGETLERKVLLLKAAIAALALAVLLSALGLALHSG